MNNCWFVLIFLLSCFFQLQINAQTGTTTYHLELNQEKVSKTGKDVIGMTINHSIPGPAIRFKEGGYAIIYVKNNMDVETSIHWHGILLPNFFDGVPYLTTPPIMPGQTQKYEFTLRQSGTYWYHSHTMLQEQSGVYGSIVIEPKEETIEYNKELVILLSDWTDEKPMSVLRFLKRGTEWYNWRKGTATPLNQVIQRRAFGAQMNFWKQRMESADIADVYYPVFLMNGKPIQEYPEFEPGDKLRLRIINGSASSQYWMSFGGEDPLLISADGQDVISVKHNKTFIAVAETYDFILTIPEEGKIEFRATVQDGSGESKAFIGKGNILEAPEIPKPDKIGMMQKMAEMDMRMGAPALKFRPKKYEPYQMKENWGMHMNHEMEGMDHSTMNQHDQPDTGQVMNRTSDTTKMNISDTAHHAMSSTPTMDSKGEMQEMGLFSEYNYNYLKSPENTTFRQNAPVKEVLLNLTGNMSRYIWSMNGIPLSETDEIEIKGDQVTRIILNNLTMMHHPMHLHGHFFRVINKHGEHSPLKHTVNVPPMQQVTIEFYGSEYGDWFFHCHVLYHLVSGMARVFSYGTERDSLLAAYPVSGLIQETNLVYGWGTAEIATHFTGMNFTYSNIRNQLNFSTEIGYNENYESEITYERYLYDYLRVFGGVNAENRTEDLFQESEISVVAGIRWFTPYMFDLDLRIDNELRPRISLGRSIMLFPRFMVFGYYECQLDPKWTDRSQGDTKYDWEIVWKAGGEYLLSKNFALLVSYESRFGGGAGITILF